MPENAARLNIPREKCLAHLNVLKQHPELRDKLAQVFEQKREYETETNPDYGLYTGGFTSTADKAKFEMIQQCAPDRLASLNLDFEDKRFNELFFRYKARNYPFALTPQELEKWHAYRHTKMMDGFDSPNLTRDEFVIELENCAHEHEDDAAKLGILKTLYDFVQTI